MKAITLWQPWASLVLVGAKPYEFRSWRFPRIMVGERIAIHASARPIKRAEIFDLIGRLEADQPEANPCLRKEIALPFLKRVLAWLDSTSAKGGLFDTDFSAPIVEPFEPPRSCVLATAMLGTPLIGHVCAREFGVTTVAGAATNDSDRDEHFNWGWPLNRIEAVVPPDPVVGKQGLWDWTPPGAAQREGKKIDPTRMSDQFRAYQSKTGGAG